MSPKLPTRSEALHLLRKVGCPVSVIKHTKAVSKLAVEIGRAAIRNGYHVDIELVEIGALLHDIGRVRTHDVHHAVDGGEIAESLGLPESVVSVIRRHVGAGITADEARKLGWPTHVYMPETPEEKIVTYADKIVGDLRCRSLEHKIKRLSNELPCSSLDRFRKLHEEIAVLTGGFECPH